MEWRQSLSLAACLLSAACGPSSGTSQSQNAVTTANGSCDLTPIDKQGNLPACAAGIPDGTKPGVPYNFTGTVTNGLTRTAAEQAADDDAAARAEARNPPDQDPIDRGFAPQKVTPQ